MISRRELIKISVASSGSLLLQIPLSVDASIRKLKRGSYYDAWLEISPENNIYFSLDKVEMGQGVVNSLVAILAEEINTDPLMIDVQLATVGHMQRNPQYTPGWGTGASSSIHSLWPVLREAGAILNLRMLHAAARHWKVEPSSLFCQQAQVIDAAGDRSVRFAKLIADVVAMEGPEKVTFKARDDYQWIGRKIPVRDIELKTTGAASYCSDIQADELPIAVVVRCPYPRGVLQSYQWQVGKEPKDVRILHIGEQLVLLGSDFYRLNKAKAYLNIDWSSGHTLPEDNQQLQRLLLAGLEDAGETVYSRGSSEGSSASLSASYLVPYLAHATLEPMNCTVLVAPDSWTVWAPSQKPAHALSIAVKISGLAADKVTVHTGFVGGGFGRRLKQDYVTEACLIAKKLGHSVKVMWSREDDFQHGYYRPAIAARLEAWADSSGIKELEYRVVSSEAGPLSIGGLAGIQLKLAGWWRQLKGETALRDQAIDGVNRLPYTINSQSINLKFIDVGLPTGLWRSVGNSFTGFFIESFIDELAWHFRQDPIEYRLQTLKKTGLKNALTKVRKLSSWGVGNDDNTACGVACYHCFGTSVAMVIEVKQIDNVLHISRVWCVVDCGMAIDPDGIRKQVEGGVNFGLCAALYGELELIDGRVASSNFDDYPVLRMQQSPSIEVEIVISDKPPTGIGEPATPLVAPALYNAVFALTGRRYRQLPLKRQLQGNLSL